MTPGQARGALAGFALVLAGATVNAVYLQQGERAPLRDARQPSRLERKPAVAAALPHGGAAAPEAPLRIARFAPAPTPVPARVEAGADPETVRAIQRELATRGFGPLPSDGSLDLATRAAILAYEQDQRLAPTATPSADLLRRLVLGTPIATAAPGEASAGQAASTEAEAVIAGIQRSLVRLGYRPGRADGQFGEETAHAIHDFEIDRGMVPKGRISAELVRQLEVAQRAGGR
jgi:peptidoglycan hydrolase-like protein with peptidoglycan-binding domain